MKRMFKKIATTALATVMALSAVVALNPTTVKADGWEADFSYADADWSPSVWGAADDGSQADASTTVTGAGSYSMTIDTSAAAGEGVMVFVVDIVVGQENLAAQNYRVSDLKLTVDGSEFAIDTSKIVTGDIEEKGNFRIELFNAYGPTAVSEKYDAYEHMQDAMAKNAEITKKATDGESDAVYGFGHNVAQSSENHESFFYTWDVRWDLYKELGYPEVETLSDMIGLFKDMKKICPTDENGNPTYAVSLWNDWDGDMVMYVKSTATAYYGYDEHGLGLYDPETGKFHDALEEDGPYLECLKFYNDLYQNDLVDPNSMTQKYDAMSEKLQAGGIFFSIFNYSGSAGYNSDEHVKDGKMMCTLAPEQARPIVYGMSTAGGNRVWSIGASTEHPELCMEIINWLCTPEGTMIYNYGPKELCWDYDEEGYAYLTEFGKACAADRKTEMPDGKTFNDGCLQINNTTWSINAINPESNGETYNKEYWKSTNEAIASDILVDWRNHTGCVTTQEYLEKTDYVLAPASNFVLASKDGEFKTTWKSVTDVITTYSWKAIYADSDEEFYEIVDEMIELANDYGYEECVEWSVEQARIRYEQEEAVRK